MPFAVPHLSQATIAVLVLIGLALVVAWLELTLVRPPADRPTESEPGT